MQVYLVGGAVRDELLGLPVHERDYVVVGAHPEALLAKGFVPVGNDFPVFLHPQTHEEYALARTERKSGAGYTGFSCYAAPDVTLEDDLLRRDLTINAIAKDEHGEFYDPYNGIRDLTHRILRHVSPAFSEDPLRVLRVARFAARFKQFDFHIAEETLRLMRQVVASGEISHLTAERVWLETRKALATENPEVYFQVLHEVGALDIILSATTKNQELQLAMLKKHALAQDSTPETLLWERFVLVAFDLRKEFSPPPNVAEALKVPKLYAKAAQETEQLVMQLNNQELTAADILAIYHRNDAFRRPEQFERVLRCTNVILANTVRAEALDVQILQVALPELQQISVHDILAAGYQHRKITEELDKKRLHHIAALFHA